MKKNLSVFFRQGLAASVGGPVILAIVYLSLGAAGTVESLPVERIAGEIFTSALLAFIAGGVSVVYQIDRLSLAVQLNHRIKDDSVLLMVEIFLKKHLHRSHDCILVHDHGADNRLLGFETVRHDPLDQCLLQATSSYPSTT